MEQGTGIGSNIESILRKIQQDQSIIGKTNDFMKFVDERGYRPGLRALRNLQEDLNGFFKKMLNALQFGFKQVLDMLAKLIEAIKGLRFEAKSDIIRSFASNTKNITNNLWSYITKSYYYHSVYQSFADNRSYVDKRITQYSQTIDRKEPEKDSWLKKILDKLVDKTLDKVYDRTIGALLDKAFDSLYSLFAKKDIKTTGLDEINGKLSSIIDLLTAISKASPAINGKSSNTDAKNSSDSKFKLPSLGRVNLKEIFDMVKKADFSDFHLPKIDGDFFKGLGKRALKSSKKFTKIVPGIGDALSIAGSVMEIADASPEEKGRTIAKEIGNQVGGYVGSTLLSIAGGVIGNVPGAIIGSVAGDMAGSAIGEAVGNFVYDKKDDIVGFVNKIPQKAMDIATTSGNWLHQQTDSIFKSINDFWGNNFTPSNEKIINKNSDGAEKKIKSSLGNSKLPTSTVTKENEKNNTFNININGVNKSTNEIMNELVTRIKEAAGTMGEVAFGR